MSNPPRRTIHRSAALAALVVVGALAGCGDDDGPDTSVPAAPPTTTATSATAPRTSPEGTTMATVQDDPLSTGDIPGDTAAGTVP